MLSAVRQVADDQLRFPEGAVWPRSRRSRRSSGETRYTTRLVERDAVHELEPGDAVRLSSALPIAVVIAQHSTPLRPAASDRPFHLRIDRHHSARSAVGAAKTLTPNPGRHIQRL